MPEVPREARWGVRPETDDALESSPLVTVYIANHNYGLYLEQAIRSVLRQTLTDFELILIDDGSTDDSREIIESYASDEKIITVFQHNKGLNVTNNIALRAARGRYIMRLDADDWLDEHALRILSDALEREPDVGLVFPDYYLADQDGNILDLVRRDDLNEVTLLDRPAHGACTMIRTQSLREAGGYGEAFRCQDGYDLWLRFVGRYGVRNVNLPLFYYRRHGNNLTQDETRLLETRARILAEHSERRTEHFTLAIVPVRGKVLDPGSRALQVLENRALIDWTLDTALAAERVDDVLVTSPDSEVLAHVRKNYGERVRTVLRDTKLAMVNSYLDDTVVEALAAYAELRQQSPDVVAILFVESPFRLPRHVDSAIDVLDVFDTDSVVAVRPETDTFYRHDGDGLRAFGDVNPRLRLEAEELYREVGNLHVISTDRIKESLVAAPGGRVGHIVLDEHAAFSVLTGWDWKVAQLIAREGSYTPGSPEHAKRVENET